MEWTPDIAYITGLIVTDGSLSVDKRHIDFTSKDLQLIETFARILQLKNKIGIKTSSYSKGRKYFRIQFGNVEFYKFLLSLGLTPRKTKTIGILKIPDKYMRDFLRGHLDGDGFTISYWDKRWKSSFMLYTGFISASKKHLVWIKECISKLYKIEGSLRFNGRSTYQLMYAKKSSILLLEKIYYNQDLPCLERKRSKIWKSLGIIRDSAQVAKLANAHI